MLIKITPADKAFGDCVKARVNWTCESCRTYYPESNRRGLHCSHFHGRGNWSIRLDPLNAFAHCFHCHMYFEANPHEFTVWALEQMGQGAYDILLEKKNNTSLGKEYKRTKGKGEVAKHYREEYKRIASGRGSGETGRIEFIGWI